MTPSDTVPSTPSDPAAESTCPKCGAQLARSHRVEGLCPRCLLATAEQAPERAAPLPAIELANRFNGFEILRLLGQGGMGAVYQARQLKLDRMVAIKVMRPDLEADPTFAERFVREAKTLARLSHPGIVAIYDFGEVDGLFYLAMELVDGSSLRELMAASRLGIADLDDLVPQLCDALQYAHDQGVVHRDIKPENILVDAHGRTRLADFGLAKNVGGAGQHASVFTLTATHHGVGTPHYVAPEQAMGGVELDHRADLFSLGVVLYEALTGRLPIGRFDPPSATSGVDPRVADLIMRLLDNDPDKRWPSAQAVRQAFVETRSSAPRSDSQGSFAPPHAPSTRSPENPADAAQLSPSPATEFAGIARHPRVVVRGLLALFLFGIGFSDWITINGVNFSAWKSWIHPLGIKLPLWTVALLPALLVSVEFAPWLPARKPVLAVWALLVGGLLVSAILVAGFGTSGPLFAVLVFCVFAYLEFVEWRERSALSEVRALLEPESEPDRVDRRRIEARRRKGRRARRERLGADKPNSRGR